MKHIKIIITALSLSVIFLPSCKKGPIWGVKGKGNNEIRVINVSGFSKIDLSIDAFVSYVQDSIYRVEISAQPNIQDIIETKLEGDRLVIKSDRIIRNHTTIEIIVHSPSIYGLYISGSGHIDAPNRFNTNSLEMDVSGSGDITLSSISVPNLNGDISGSGNIKISGGTVVNENFNVSGSGNIDALNLQSDKTIADVSGSGDISVWVLQNLNATISGSGNLTYKGSPAINLQVSGSGKITHLN